MPRLPCRCSVQALVSLFSLKKTQYSTTSKSVETRQEVIGRVRFYARLTKRSAETTVWHHILLWNGQFFFCTVFWHCLKRFYPIPEREVPKKKIVKGLVFCKIHFTGVFYQYVALAGLHDIMKTWDKCVDANMTRDIYKNTECYSASAFLLLVRW